VLVNLLRNANDALCSQGGGRIRLSAKIDASQVLLLVEDDGPGIDAALSERVFEPFETTKTEGEGTGLGLPISRALAREAGGELNLAPGVLGGACFALRLPVYKEQLAKAS
jgi:two-component system NtrC family sensor kinase